MFSRHDDRLNEVGSSRLPAGLYRQAEKIIEATRLIQLGARAGLAQQLTGLEKSKVNRLYVQLMGRPSPSGQTPFSDAWYLKDKRRLLQAAFVWKLYQQLIRNSCSTARVYIDVYESYLAIINEPLLSLTRASLVPQLVGMGVWQERGCQTCKCLYLASVASRGHTCPGCELYYRYRCRACGSALEVKDKGRYPKTCPDCREKPKKSS
ncbi:MAG: hypothetical protein GY792_05215 [Gammaproteobacteria bacterium]|nr:hypothetical protein [Gammaproteobacteria bacterium]